MIEIEVEREGAEFLEMAFTALSGGNIDAALSRAAQRAATHAKKIGSMRVRQLYTIKPADVKSAIRIKKTDDGALLWIKGPLKSVGHYQAKKRKQGIFVSVRKGSGNVIPRSFAWSNTFFRRDGKKRLPISRIFGPAVPQLFGNQLVIDDLSRAAMEMYQRTLAHEVDRLAGGV